MLSILSEVDVKTPLVDNNSFSNKEKVMMIQRQPIMECAIDVLTTLANSGCVILKARGDDIPTAVGVANVVTEKMMKNTSQITGIAVDSENGAGRYGMTLVSTIQITISKKLN